jgi:BirA family transcriptional regulator, biotin operon repressor / biotin---[acetyl-CoA-carboxylase] ligase
MSGGISFRGRRSNPPPSDIADALANAASRLGSVGRHFFWFTEVTSTNDVAAMLAETGAVEGTVVSAEAQTAGRGRLGRVWISPPMAGLYVSLVLRPPSEVVTLLTIAAGAAVSEAIEAATGLQTAVKWPNDVHVAGRKVAGILAEGGTSPAGGAHVVLGFGINLMPAAYPPEIARRATSLEGELGRGVDRGAVLTECLAAFAAHYDRLRSHRHKEILDAWRHRAASSLGRPVEWEANRSRHHGIAEDVDDRGALLVRTDAGVERVISGEVRWI